MSIPIDLLADIPDRLPDVDVDNMALRIVEELWEVVDEGCRVEGSGNSPFIGIEFVDEGCCTRDLRLGESARNSAVSGEAVWSGWRYIVEDRRVGLSRVQEVIGCHDGWWGQ
jgi:hypothetical protein